jgi:hypothetical protein
MRIRKQLSPRVIKRFTNMMIGGALLALFQIYSNKAIFGIIDLSMN